MACYRDIFTFYFYPYILHVAFGSALSTQRMVVKAFVSRIGSMDVINEFQYTFVQFIALKHIQILHVPSYQ
jgi:hypothetical protein